MIVDDSLVLFIEEVLDELNEKLTEEAPAMREAFYEILKESGVIEEV